MVEYPRSLRTLLVTCLALVMIFALAACTLSASDAPVIDSGDSGPPVPGDESIFDEKANEDVVPPADAGGGQAEPLPAATETAVPAAPADAPPPQQEQPAPPQVKPTEGKPPATYSLQKGEFPFCIARRFNLNQAELLALNGLTLDSKPGVGTTLQLPQTGNTFVTPRALKSHPTTYSVKSGDTLYTIACQFGDVSPDMIALANGLKEPYNLSSGQSLNIP